MTWRFFFFYFFIQIKFQTESEYFHFKKKKIKFHRRQSYILLMSFSFRQKIVLQEKKLFFKSMLRTCVMERSTNLPLRCAVLSFLTSSDLPIPLYRQNFEWKLDLESVSALRGRSLLLQPQPKALFWALELFSEKTSVFAFLAEFFIGKIPTLQIPDVCRDKSSNTSGSLTKHFAFKTRAGNTSDLAAVIVAWCILATFKTFPSHSRIN